VHPTLVVCPIEFSEADRVTLALARSLARWHDAELHVLHVRPGRRFTGADAGDEPLRTRLAGFIDSRHPAGAAITARVLSGDPVTAVVEYAQQMAADLVVVGQHGGRGRGYWSAGAFARALGRTVECPIIVVPDSSAPRRDVRDDAPFGDILCAVDFSEASIRGLAAALALARASAGRLTLLHVLEGFPYETVYSGTRAMRLIEEFEARVAEVNDELHLLVPREASNWCEVEADTVSGDALEAIPAAAMARVSDLIVMGLPQRPRLEQLVAGSTVKGVMRRAPCPVLLVPGPATPSAGAFLPDRRVGRSATRTGLRVAGLERSLSRLDSPREHA
jgi:nucleotide-binding universal stress UspA family protein